MSIEDEARAAVGWVEGHLPGHHHKTPAAQAAAAVTINPSTPGGPVSLFTEAKAKAHAFVDDLEHIDENAIAAVEAVAVSPTGVGIVNELAAIAHIPDPAGLLNGLLNAAKMVSAALRAADAATAATAQAIPIPAGPVVAGQA